MPRRPLHSPPALRRARAVTLCAATAVIVSSLLLLVLTPGLRERRMAALRGEVEALTVADRHTLNLRFSLEREVDLLKAYAEEEDETLLRLSWENRRTTVEAMRVRQSDADRLPAGVRARIEEGTAVTARWHTEVDAALERRALPAGSRGAMPPFPPYLYGDALEETAVARRQLAAEIEQREQELAALRRTGRALERTLGLLALLSIGLVLWISLRLRAVALEAARLHGQALGANPARAHLLRGVTHDLRNPIGAADLFRQGLLAGAYGELTEAQEHAITRMGTSLGGALSLLDDLSDLSRAEVGELEIRCGPVEIAPILRNLREEVAPAATTAGITLAFPPCESVPVVEADARRVRQILENLVSNAIRHTPPGGSVTIGCARYGGGPRRRGPVAIEVVDTGPGISPDRLEEVFGEYVRHAGTAVSPAGSGLGLTISRHLARSMGGDLTLRSEAGRGSTFTLWLPGSTSAAPAVELADPVPS
jgi:signal transduction histidine kinase